MNYLKEHFWSLSILAIIFLLSIGSFFIDIRVLQEVIRNAGIWAPFLYILTKSSTQIIAPLSGTALYVLSVPLFGFWPAILYSFLGDLLGATVTFYISRLYGRPVVQYFAGKKNMIHIEKALETMSTTKGFVSIRLALISMPEIASYAAGLTKINFLLFITIHMIVDMVPIFALASSGLLIGGNFPLWLNILFVGVATVVTVASLVIFVWMVKKAEEKK